LWNLISRHLERRILRLTLLGSNNSSLPTIWNAAKSVAEGEKFVSAGAAAKDEPICGAHYFTPAQ
jgi:hypothetical protein